MRPDADSSLRSQNQADDLDAEYIIDEDIDVGMGNPEDDSDNEEKEKLRSAQAMPLTYVDGKLINTEIFMKKKRKRDSEDELEEHEGSDSSEDDDDGSDGEEDLEESEGDEDADSHPDNFEEGIENEDSDGEHENAEADNVIRESRANIVIAHTEEPSFKTIAVSTSKSTNSSGISASEVPLSSILDKFEAKPKDLDEQLMRLQDAVKGKPVKLREVCFLLVLCQISISPPL